MGVFFYKPYGARTSAYATHTREHNGLKGELGNSRSRMHLL